MVCVIPVIRATIDAWTYRPDGKWDVVTTVGGVETARSIQEGCDPVDLFREAEEELRKRALKTLGRRK